jgi:hypothetical protein
LAASLGIVIPLKRNKVNKSPSPSQSPRAHHNLTAGNNTKIIDVDPDEERHRWPGPPESAAENEVAS